ncbi:MAG: porphobilinogen synthase [Proteobacteria bacterium]|nr:porphobilinogen synthase [Pseudomonadota bacterium]
MHFPEYRARRTRRKANARRLMRETAVDVGQLIAPLFVVEGQNREQPLAALPGVSAYSVDRLVEVVAELQRRGVGTVWLAASVGKRDELARAAVDKRGLLPAALTQLRATAPELVLFSDLDLTPFTSHGHPGVLRNQELDNDATLELLTEAALLHGRAGADFVVTSGAVDGEVALVRDALDEEGLDDVGIIARAVTFASAFSAGGWHRVGEGAPVDVGGYRLDPANGREALREATLDADEGADALVVCPALPSLDIIAMLVEELDLPVIAAEGSGEHRLHALATERALLDGDRALVERLICLRRAGAAAVASFAAAEAARILTQAS